MVPKDYLKLFSIFVIISLSILFLLYEKSPEITSNVIKSVECDDRTEVGDCSKNNFGNMCVISKEGIRLEFSDNCYD